MRRTSDSNPMRHTCEECGGDLIPLSHSDNKIDFDNNVRRQHYQLCQCRGCDTYWGVTTIEDWYAGTTTKHDNKGKLLAYVSRYRTPEDMGYKPGLHD